MSDTRRSAHVIIVGGGPGGAVLAFLLARAGVRTTVLERHHDFAREFRGEVLMPGGLEPFDQMGLWEELDRVPHVALNRFGLYVHGQCVARIELSDEIFGRFGPRWVSQPELLEMLVAQAAQFPSFTLERGATVRHLLEEEGRVRGVSVLTEKGEREVRGDFVIGADGRTSVVRRRSGVRVVEDSVPMDVVWLKLPRPAPETGTGGIEPRAYVGGGRLLICAPTPDGLLQLAWIIAKDSFSDVRSRGMPALIDEMARQVDPVLAEHLRLHREASVRPFLLSTVADRVETWSRPGMLLIGDAAHTTSPVGAQGLNLAIRDAIVAANRMSPLLREGAGPEQLDRAAREVQEERDKEIRAIQRLQSLPPKLILRDAGWARLALRVLPHLLRGQVRKVRNEGVFGRFAWGVSKVQLID